MAAFNEQNTPALGFLSGLVQGLSPTLIGELNAKKKQREEEKRQQDIKDLAIYKEGQANKRNNAKLKLDAELKAAELDRERRDLVLNANNRAAELKYKLDKEAEQADKDRANELEIAKLRKNGDFNINNFGKGGSYTPQDAEALEKIARELPKFTNKDRLDPISNTWVKGDTQEMQAKQQQLYSAAQKIRSGWRGVPLSDAEKAFIDEQLKFGKEPEQPEQDSGYLNYLMDRANNWGFGLPQTQAPTKLRATPTATAPTAPTATAKLSTKRRENTWDSIDSATKDLVAKKMGTTAGEAAKKWNNLSESARADLIKGLQTADFNTTLTRPYLRGQQSIPKAKYNAISSGKTPVKDW